MGTSRTGILEVAPATEVVQAAGGLMVRRSIDGPLEVAIVHRPGRDDWSFPKGKLEAGETFEHAALREVYEETGFDCRLGRFIGHTQYRDRKDRHKVAAYWVMTPLYGAFRVNDEVDELRWMRLEGAARLLTYERDRELLVVLAAADEIDALV